MKIAICPGSFDPITKGHVDIIERTSKLFDKVYAVVMVNPAKKPTFTTEERVDMIKKCTAHLENVEAESFEGLIADYAKQKNASTLVKGLRAVTDFEYEFQQALINKKLNGDVETVFLAASSEHMFLSSSVIKQVCQLGGDISLFIPKEISEEVITKIKKG